MFVVPQISLTLAAALAIVNVWLTLRVGRVRGQEKVSVGDGGNDRVLRRMRAQANLVENAWAVLALVVLIELSIGANAWLWAVAALFVAGRLAHPFGMDGARPWRTVGAVVTLAVQLGLALWALTIAVQSRGGPAGPSVQLTVPRG